MTVGAGLTGLAGLGSLGAGLYSLFGGGAQAPQQFNLPGLGTAAGGALGGISNLGAYNTYQSGLPAAQGITQNLINNPYAAQYQAGANTASGIGGAAAMNQYGTGGTLIGGGNATLAQAFDPQQALYQRTLAQTQAQQNAANASAGVGTTPYGAGLQNQNIENFNIDWQNQQLQREISGLGAAGTAFQTGTGMQTQAPVNYLQSAALPYGTYGAIGQGKIGALTTLGQYGAAGANQANQSIQDYISYLQAGQGQQSVNNQTAAIQNQIQQQGLQNAFGGLANIGSAYGFSGIPSGYGFTGTPAGGGSLGGMSAIGAGGLVYNPQTGTWGR